MSFLKKLFGGSGGQPSAAGEPSVADSCDYAGFTIKATPMPEGAQFRLAALIEKEIGGETRSHRMIRADLFSSKDEAAQFALRKAEQMIDEQGEAIFQS